MSYGFGKDQTGFLKLNKSYKLIHKDKSTQAGLIKKLPVGQTIALGFGLQLVKVEYKLGNETVNLFCGYQDRMLPGDWELTDEEW